MTKSGWRKPTPNLEAAAQLAQAGAPKSIAKGQCMRAVKRAAPYLGLKAGDVLLLDTLAAFSQNQDWEDGQRAIVWPSNAYLMERTGFALSTLKRHARKLAETGLIAFKDSPNGKRWGHRDNAGYIVEAYGFDLTPLATRCQAHEALADQRDLERKACQRLKRQITILRRRIRVLIDVGDKLTDDARARGSDKLDAVLAIKAKDQDLSALTRKAQALALLHHELAVEENAKEPVAETQKTDPKPCKNEPHLQTTKKHQDGFCNRIGIQTVIKSCSAFSEWTHSIIGAKPNWQSLETATERLGPMIGVSRSTWEDAQKHLGGKLATASLALVFEKTQDGTVGHPDAYLRGMLKKHENGELNLSRSFYGRLRQMAA